MILLMFVAITVVIKNWDPCRTLQDIIARSALYLRVLKIRLSVRSFVTKIITFCEGDIGWDRSVKWILVLYLAVKLVRVPLESEIPLCHNTSPVTFGATTLWFVLRLLTRFWQFLVRWRALDLFFRKHQQLSKSVQKRKVMTPNV